MRRVMFRQTRKLKIRKWYRTPTPYFKKKMSP